MKALVKADPDVTLAGQEAIFILARAAVRREREAHKEEGGERGEGRGLVAALGRRRKRRVWAGCADAREVRGAGAGF